MNCIQCQIQLSNDSEYKIGEYFAGDGFISIVADGDKNEPNITDTYQNHPGATTVFINSRNARFNITVRPKNPCQTAYAKKTCPDLTLQLVRIELMCVGDNYNNFRCDCRKGITQTGSDKYHPTCPYGIVYTRLNAPFRRVQFTKV